MKKIFDTPVVEVKSLSTENDVMVGIFAKSAGPTKNVTYIFDTKTDSEEGDQFNYWTTK